MKDKDLEFIASQNMDFKKIEKWLIDMWVKEIKWQFNFPFFGGKG